MTNVSGLAGQPLTLECDTNGFPVPEVVWLKEGQLVGVSRGGWDGGGASMCVMSLGMPGCRGSGGLWS